jgi:hypothetical protein
MAAFGSVSSLTPIAKMLEMVAAWLGSVRRCITVAVLWWNG